MNIYKTVRPRSYAVLHGPVFLHVGPVRPSVLRTVDHLYVAFMSRVNEQPSINNIEAIIEQKLKESIEKVLNRNTYSNNSNNRRNNDNNSNRNRNRDRECYICKKKGHI